MGAAILIAANMGCFSISTDAGAAPSLDRPALILFTEHAGEAAITIR
jgi:hypothetical protein